MLRAALLSAGIFVVVPTYAGSDPQTKEAIQTFAAMTWEEKIAAMHAIGANSRKDCTGIMRDGSRLCIDIVEWQSPDNGFIYTLRSFGGGVLREFCLGKARQMACFNKDENKASVRHFVLRGGKWYPADDRWRMLPH